MDLGAKCIKSRLPLDSQCTPSVLPLDSESSPTGLPLDSHWTPSPLPLDSQSTPSPLPVDSKWTPSGLPVESQLNPTGSSGSSWGVHWESTGSGVGAMGVDWESSGSPRLLVGECNIQHSFIMMYRLSSTFLICTFTHVMSQHICEVRFFSENHIDLFRIHCVRVPLLEFLF